MFALDETIQCSLQAVLIIEVIADRGCMSEEQCANYFKISFAFSRHCFSTSLYLCHDAHQSDAECNLVACFIAIPQSLFVRDWKKEKWKPGNTRPPFSLKFASDSVVIISLLPRDITFLVSFAMKDMDLMKRSVSADFFWWWFLQAKAWP